MKLPVAQKLVFKAKPRLSALNQKYHAKTWLDYAKITYPTSSKHKIATDFLTSFRTVCQPLLGAKKKLFYTDIAIEPVYFNVTHSIIQKKWNINIIGYS